MRIIFAFLIIIADSTMCCKPKEPIKCLTFRPFFVAILVGAKSTISYKSICLLAVKPTITFAE